MLKEGLGAARLAVCWVACLDKQKAVKRADQRADQRVVLTVESLAFQWVALMAGKRAALKAAQKAEC